MRHLTEGVENMPPDPIEIPQRMATHDARIDHPSGCPGREGLTGCPIWEKTVRVVQSTAPGKLIKVRVILKVYSTSFGCRYAVVSQDKLLSKDCGYINLKHCTVRASADNGRTGMASPGASPLGSGQRCKPTEHHFEIISHKNDFRKLVFCVQSSSELEQWLAVLSDPEEREGDPASPEMLIGSPVRRSLGELSPARLNSPRLCKKQTLMPSVEEE